MMYYIVLCKLFNYDKHTESQENLKNSLYFKQVTILKILS